MRHNRWLRAQLVACSQRSTTELSASLGEQEVGFSPRQTFAHSTIDDFVREGEGNTVKVLTVYDPRLDLAESARCRAALKRYPAKCLVVIDASHVDTRLDSARRRGRSKKGTRAYARQFLSGDGKLRSVLGVMTIDGMQVDACGFLVREHSLPAYMPTCLQLKLKSDLRTGGRRHRDEIFALVQAASCSDPEPVGPDQPGQEQHRMPRQRQPPALATLHAAPPALRRQGVPLRAVRPDALAHREGLQSGMKA